MKPPILTPRMVKKYQRSFKNEIRRFGFDMDFATELDAPLMEFEAATICFTTDRDFVRLPVIQACHTLYGLSSVKLTTERLLRIMKNPALDY